MKKDKFSCEYPNWLKAQNIRKSINIQKNFQELTQNKSSRTVVLVQRVQRLARERDISLKMFKYISERMCINRIEKTQFKAACFVLLDTIRAYKLPLFVKSKEHLQQMLDGKFFLKKGESGFEDLANQDNVTYGGIVYIIRPKKPLNILNNVLTEIYIGVTWKTLIERFIEHTEDAIESYIKNFEWSNRLIEHLILKALEMYLTETYTCDIGISPLHDYIRYEFLEMEPWQQRAEIKKIATDLFNTYFCMEVIEAHRNYETAWSRETWNIQNYPLCINGEIYQGTLYPNGLNMVISPSRPGFHSLPLYDILFIVSLGYIGPDINPMLREHYHLEIDHRIIYRRLNKFWKNWDNVLEEFFKRVLQTLLEEEHYQWKEIAKAIHRSPSYRSKKNFRKWFFGLNVTQLRDIIKRENFNWNNLGELAREFKADLYDQNTVKRIPIETWIEWFIKNIGMEEIARMSGYKNAESFGSSWSKQGRVSIFQEKFAATYNLAVKKYRKKRTIELLTDEDFIETSLDSRLYWIYVKEFGFKSWEDYAVNRPSQGLRNCRNFFDTLFKEENLTTYDLEHLTARNYKENQIIYNIIKEIIKS